MKFRVIPGVLALAACCALPACNAPGEPPAAAPALSTGPADATQDLLGSLKQETLRNAFAWLPSLIYTERVRIEQIGPDSEVVAVREYRLRRRPGDPAPQMLASDSSGTFDLGFLGRFAGESADDSAGTGSRAAHLIPEDPPYLSPRTRHAFQYERRPDTLLNGTAAGVLEITAAGEDGEDQTIRHARLFFDPAGREVTALSLTRENPAFLFQEKTQTYVSINRNAQGEWLPDSTSVLTRVDMPLGAARTFRISRRYEDFQRGTP